MSMLDGKPEESAEEYDREVVADSIEELWETDSLKRTSLGHLAKNADDI